MTIINNIEIDNTKYVENNIKKSIWSNSPLSDKLNVVIVVSNPVRCATRYILAKEFIRRMRDCMDVRLYVVELAYGDQGFHLTDLDNQNHLRLRTPIPLWHKENLINIAANVLLPKDWQNICWVDADIEFDDPHWVHHTLKLLNGSYDVVQLFSHCLFLDTKGDTEHIFSGFGFQHTKRQKRSKHISDINSFWHPGFGWACTRKFYDKMGGLYENCVTGDGDMVMASCWIQGFENSMMGYDFKQSILDFQQRVGACRVGYVPGIILHHYHGSIESRAYEARNRMLIDYIFSPQLHLTKDKYGLIVPTDLFPAKLLEKIQNHFVSKNEDNLHIVNLKYNSTNPECNQTNPECNQTNPECNQTNPECNPISYKVCRGYVDGYLKSNHPDINYCLTHNILHSIKPHSIKDIEGILKSFKYHQKRDRCTNTLFYAYNFGSTCVVYLTNNIIVKMYLEKLSWTAPNHRNICEIFNREVKILEKLKGTIGFPQLVDFDPINLIIRTTYEGVSVFDTMILKSMPVLSILPDDWIIQLKYLTDSLTEHNIYYPEFNLKNIVIKDNQMCLIDFGLASICRKSNNANYKIFVQLIQQMQCYDVESYELFIDNMRKQPKYSDNVF